MIINGDSLDVLKTLEDNSVDTVITDPPYGYSFMGKDWDKAVPSVEIWKECLRVLKPGAFMCVMSAPRSDVQNAMISRLMEAGFRLDFTPIYWTYASGFPKAGNIGKLVDKRLGAERGKLQAKVGYVNDVNHKGGDYSGEFPDNNPITDQAKALDGSYAGFQPKPAVEVIIVAMKPLSEKTYVDQALKNRKGITWLDDCRVPFETDDGSIPQSVKRVGGVRQSASTKIGQLDGHERNFEGNVQGRFPANLLVSDDVLNDGVERKSPKPYNEKRSGFKKEYVGGDMESPVENPTARYGDTITSYSRYFDLDAWARERLPAEQAMTFPFAIFPKASKSEKNKGLDNLPDMLGGSLEGGNDKRNGQDKPQLKPTKNGHPTVKPLKLMSYLITLFSREGDTVLDPFVGSGTTVLAAKQLGRQGIGIEREAEYAEIARARVEHAKTEDDTNKQLQLIE